MGRVYWILVWDAFSDSMNLINPRLHHEGERNWWDCPQSFTGDDVIERHDLLVKYGPNYHVVFWQNR